MIRSFVDRCSRPVLLAFTIASTVATSPPPEEATSHETWHREAVTPDETAVIEPGESFVRVVAFKATADVRVSSYLVATAPGAPGARLQVFPPVTDDEGISCRAVRPEPDAPDGSLTWTNGADGWGHTYEDGETLAATGGDTLDASSECNWSRGTARMRVDNVGPSAVTVRWHASAEIGVAAEGAPAGTYVTIEVQR